MSIMYLPTQQHYCPSLSRCGWFGGLRGMNVSGHYEDRDYACIILLSGRYFCHSTPLGVVSYQVGVRWMPSLWVQRCSGSCMYCVKYFLPRWPTLAPIPMNIRCPRSKGTVQISICLDYGVLMMIVLVIWYVFQLGRPATIDSLHFDASCIFQHSGLSE